MGDAQPMGDDLDAGMRTLSRHTGAEFEAGRLGHRNEQAPNGADVPIVNAQDDRVEPGRNQDQVCVSMALRAYQATNALP